MTQEGIESFLSVVYNGSFSKAASALFSTQTTISRRIRMLEDELGYPLFVRGQGQRSIQLTPQGQAFLPLAEQWQTLMSMSLALINPSRYRAPLFLGAPDRLNYYFLPRFYRRFSREHPKIFFNVRSFHSVTVTDKVKSGELDAGFVSIEPMESSVTRYRFLLDRLTVVCPEGGYPEGALHPRDLDPANEIRISPELRIQQWYNEWWGRSAQPFMLLDTVNLVPYYLTEPKLFSLCPRFVAEALCERWPLEVHELSVDTPPQSFYLVFSKSALTIKPTLASFIKEFTDAYPEI